MNRDALKQIADAAVERVSPRRILQDSVTCERNTLQVRTAAETVTLDLTRFERIRVLGAGKATAAMAAALEAILGDRITDGVISVKYGHVEELKRIELREAGHPVPDEQGVAAAREILQAAEHADERTLCIVLISGGGSSLLPLPLSLPIPLPGAESQTPSLTLQDIQKTTELLLAAGTPIHQINCVRKHLSGISGGRLCGSLYPATTLSLIISDVVGDSLESIASGLTSPDTTTYAEARAITRHYGIADRLPRTVRDVLERGARQKIPETPKPGDPIFERVHNVLVGTNATALEAARKKAEELNFNTTILTSQLAGESREVAKVFSGIARDIVRSQMICSPPACILAGGETTVTLRGTGKGGRNQEMALAFLEEISHNPALYEGVSFASVATDGNDGPTDAAGGYASVELAARAGAQNLDITAALAANDSYHFLEAIGGLHRTGPTNTNVSDLQILLVE